MKAAVVSDSEDLPDNSDNDGDNDDDNGDDNDWAINLPNFAFTIKLQ